MNTHLLEIFYKLQNDMYFDNDTHLKLVKLGPSPELLLWKPYEVAGPKTDY